MKYKVHLCQSHPFEQLLFDIPKEQFDRVKFNKEICLLSVRLEETLKLLVENYIEWETELLKQAQSFLVWRTITHDQAMEDRLTLERRLVNLLTSCRLYLDHTDGMISSCFGNPSDELTGIKRFKSDLYDSHLGYRVFEALRNYVQHEGLPVNAIQYKHDGVDRTVSGGIVQVTVAPKLTVCRLASTSFKKTVLAELKEHGKEIDLRVHSRDYLSCIFEIHGELNRRLSPKFQSSRRDYEATLKEYENFQGQKFDFIRLLEVHEEANPKEEIHLVRTFIDRYNQLAWRNAQLRNITREFSSNRVIQK